MESAKHWIEKLELKPHPEGGWFRRVYESDILLENSRSAMTSIYYLLEGHDFSALHRLESDEQWHFYAGSPTTIHEIEPSGRYISTTLGDGSFQYTVKAGNLFGATVKGEYALVGCTVVPGFDFEDFVMPSRSELLSGFPDHAELITHLSR
jgi:predicted cupin superfamily sugar epimerase